MDPSVYSLSEIALRPEHSEKWCAASAEEMAAHPPAKQLAVGNEKGKAIQSPEVPRAMFAGSKEEPHGSAERAVPKEHRMDHKATTEDKSWRCLFSFPSEESYIRPPPSALNRSVLIQHCDFFDPDNDGVIHLSDTFFGLRALGFHIFNCFLGMFVIHGLLSYLTQDSYIPDLRWRIYLKNIHKTLHGSDSSTIEPGTGRYYINHFENIFSEFSSDPQKQFLTFSNIHTMWLSHDDALDFIGWLATRFEFGFLWLLAKDGQGKLWKSDARACYDGVLFYRIAHNRYNEKRNAKAKQLKGKAATAAAAAPGKENTERNGIGNSKA